MEARKNVIRYRRQLVFAQMIISKKWREKLEERKKRGIDPNRDRIRHCITLLSRISFVEAKAKKMLADFICIEAGKDELILKGRLFYKSISFIQTRLKNRIETKYAKVDVLLTYWDKLYGQMQLKAS